MLLGLLLSPELLLVLLAQELLVHHLCSDSSSLWCEEGVRPRCKATQVRDPLQGLLPGRLLRDEQVMSALYAHRLSPQPLGTAERSPQHAAHVDLRAAADPRGDCHRIWVVELLLLGVPQLLIWSAGAGSRGGAGKA